MFSRRLNDHIERPRFLEKGTREFSVKIANIVFSFDISEELDLLQPTFSVSGEDKVYIGLCDAICLLISDSGPLRISNFTYRELESYLRDTNLEKSLNVSTDEEELYSKFCKDLVESISGTILLEALRSLFIKDSVWESSSYIKKIEIIDHFFTNLSSQLKTPVKLVALEENSIYMHFPATDAVYAKMIAEKLNEISEELLTNTPKWLVDKSV